MSKYVFDFKDLKFVVNRHHNRSQAPCPQKRLHERGCIETHQRNRITSANPICGKNTGGDLRPLLHLAVRDRATFESNEGLLGMVTYSTIKRGKKVHRCVALQATSARDKTASACADPQSIAPTTRPARRSLRRVLTNASDTSVVECRRSRQA